MKPLTPPDILARKGGTPIVCLAACTTPAAKLFDPQCDAAPAKVTEPLARRITAEVAVPTIGIGESPACDGQVLVVDDMLGLFGEVRPKFVKRRAEPGAAASAAVAAHAEDVRARRFPGPEHVVADSAP